MEKKSILIMPALGVLVFMITVFIISMPLLAQSPADSSSGGSSNVYLLGIIDPDGQKHIWAFPAETAIVVSKQLAAKYPGKTIDGVSFFRVTSWRDTSNLAIEANAQQGLIIADLFQEIQHLKSNTPGAQLVHRVNRLENQLREMTGPGYR